MLWPEDPRWSQDIAVLAILDGSRLIEPAGRFRIEAVRATIEGRLHLVPRLRQLPYEPRRGLGWPLWIDAPAFDLGDHLRVVPLPSPGDEAQLVHATERLLRRPLDRSRPLWEMCLLPGLQDERVGLYMRAHHAMADGVAGMAMLGALLDIEPDATAVPARPWTPAPTP